ncbi:hypothetical protein DFQ28_010692 [Apophysomyces sp. BC1034]|nr:hypothetical protein DFQ29_008298 [Apophysomyces sp. BC1021]KAG0191905.1 hypothetical protein DFQ28_010692 [Apophysomyces sp. BC1034]
MDSFSTKIEDLEDITNETSTNAGTTEDQETESSEPTVVPRPPSVNLDDVPRGWNKGVLCCGEEASEAAFELVKEEDIKNLVRFYRGSEILSCRRKQNNKDQDSKDAPLGVHFSFNLPISKGFAAGAKCIENSSRSTLIAIAHGEMSFKNHQIKPTDEFLKDIKDALKTANTDKFETYDALQKVFQNYGGRVTSTAEEILEIDGQIKDNSKEDASTSKQIEAIRKVELDKSKLIAYGGDGTVLMAEGIQKWAKTIRENPKVVLRDKFKPMYDLLDEKTRQDVIDIYDPIELEMEIYNLIELEKPIVCPGPKISPRQMSRPETFFSRVKAFFK